MTRHEAEQILDAYQDGGVIRSWGAADCDTYRITHRDGQDVILTADEAIPYLSGLTRGYATAHHLTTGD